MLLEVEPAELWVDEVTQATRPVLDVLVIPGPGEERALGLERVDEVRHPRVAEGMAEVRPELRQQPSGPILPVRDETARTLLQEHEAQQIPLVVSVQPAAEELGRGTVPAAGVPETIKPVGRMADGGDRRRQGGRRLPLGGVRRLRIEAPGELEEVGAFGSGQGQGTRALSRC